MRPRGSRAFCTTERAKPQTAGRFDRCSKAAIATLAAALAAGGQPAFEGHSEPIRGQIEERIVGSSWHRAARSGSKLRLLELSHWGFDGEVHRGRLVVHRRHARACCGDEAPVSSASSRSGAWS